MNDSTAPWHPLATVKTKDAAGWYRPLSLAPPPPAATGALVSSTSTTVLIIAWDDKMPKLGSNEGHAVMRLRMDLGSLSRFWVYRDPVAITYTTGPITQSVTAW